MKIKTIQTGFTLVSTAVPDRSTRKNPIAYTGILQGQKSRIKVPVKCFYVEVSGHKILIDAGWSKQVVDNPRKHLGLGLYFASKPLMQLEEAAINQLDDIILDGIYMTHLDCDHVSGLHDFKNVSIWTSEAEKEIANKNHIRYGRLAEGIEISTLNFIEDNDAIFGYSCDVFGDGSFIAYITPTHSIGSIIYKVIEQNSYALIVGDNGYSEDSWEKDLLPGPLYNVENMHKSLNWINKCSKDPQCVGVFCAHDPIMKNYKSIKK